MDPKTVAAGMLILAVGPAIAAELADFVPAEDGAAACWQRLYAPEHLAAHPDQQVTAMTLSMSFEAFDEADPGMHYFGLDVVLRDGRKGQAAGGCWAQEGSVRCGVDCDGGGLALQLRPDGAVLADLDTYGYIRMESECGGEDASFSLEAGLDDKLFLLPPADAKVCKALLPEW